MPIITLIMRISKHRITATEVARLAGVSQPTVSLILSRNPKARIAPETRQRVLRIAEEIGYRPNRLAQGLANRRSFAIGVIVPGFDNPFYVSVLSGAERVAAEAGYAVLISESRLVDGRAYSVDLGCHDCSRCSCLETIRSSEKTDR